VGCVAYRTLFGLLVVRVFAVVCIVVVVATGYLTGGLMSSMRFVWFIFPPLR